MWIKLINIPVCKQWRMLMSLNQRPRPLSLQDDVTVNKFPDNKVTKFSLQLAAQL